MSFHNPFQIWRIYQISSPPQRRPVGLVGTEVFDRSLVVVVADIVDRGIVDIRIVQEVQLLPFQ